LKKIDIPCPLLMRLKGYKMKVCFVGLGSIGLRHLRNLISLGKEREIQFEIHAVRSSKAERVELVDKEFYSMQESDLDYDIAFITNPTSLHFETIQEMVKRSKHLFIEKPLFSNCNRSLSELSLRENGIYYVASPLRNSNTYRVLKEILAQERVFSARAICSSYLPDWRQNSDYRTSYSAKKELGGGVRIDLIHEWDYLTDLFGFPLEVMSFQGTFSNLEIDSEDLSVYIAKYSDKLIEVHLDYFGRKTKRELELFTADDTVQVDFVNQKIFYLNRGKTIDTNNASDPYINELNHFLNLLQGNGKNKNDMGHAYKVLKMVKGIL